MPASRKPARKKRSKTGSRSAARFVDEPGEAVSDFEARTRNAPLIYRFFNAPESCAVYLSGRWRGAGIQAIHTWPTEIGMEMILGCAKNSGVAAELSLQLRARASRTGIWSRMARALRSGFVSLAGENRRVTRAKPARTGREWQETDVAGYRTDLGFRLEHKNKFGANQFRPDYAKLVENDWELTIQVLEDVRAHVQLRRVDGVAPIYFSGVLRKVR